MRSEIKSKFLQQLEIFERTDTALVGIYSSLFRIKSDKEFEEDIIQIYEIWSGVDGHFGEQGKADWFFIFHKSIRQTDYFSDCFRDVEVEILSKEEKSELRKLRYDLSNKVFSKYLDDKSESQFRGFSPEYKRLLHLADISRREVQKESIGGNIDMILWHAIHSDKNGILMKAMEYFFQEDLPQLLKKTTENV